MKQRNQRNVLFGADRGAREGGQGVCWRGVGGVEMLLAVSTMNTMGSSNSMVVKHIKPIKGVVCFHCKWSVVEVAGWK